MEPSPVLSHICTYDASPDTHNPSPSNLYRRMLMHERVAMKRECQNRSQSRILRGWIKIKATVTKWDEARKESREACHLSQTSLTSPLARLTYHGSSTSHLTQPTSSSSTLAPSSMESIARIESSSIIRIVSHRSLTTPALVGTTVAAAQSAPAPMNRRVWSSVSHTHTIATIAESSTAAAVEEGGRMSIPNTGGANQDISTCEYD